jgi:lipoic acid synthetase
MPRLAKEVRLANEQRAGMLTKSGVMVGLGETRDELMQVFRDLRSVGCDLLTIGQYLKPSSGDGHAAVERFYTPAEFDELGAAARELGFAGVASGPFVRSSYFAETLYGETAAHDADASGRSDKVIR